MLHTGLRSMHGLYQGGNRTTKVGTSANHADNVTTTTTKGPGMIHIDPPPPTDGSRGAWREALPWRRLRGNPVCGDSALVLGKASKFVLQVRDLLSLDMAERFNLRDWIVGERYEQVQTGGAR
ncbi:hypothetical protein Bbelb_293220 [Branchiostoma belcheri]|nr:hypothetical protein Bbelb_293220 [Branchiostoma belcheri]